MILLKNITQLEDNTVTMDCHVIDHIENQDFSLHFNPMTRKILSNLDGIDEYYAGHAVLHVYFMVNNSKGRKLTKESVAAWC